MPERHDASRPTLFGFAATCLLVLNDQPALAALADYVNASNQNLTRTFLTTSVPSVPVQVDIGTLAGNNTYEFIVIGTGNTSGSTALLGTLTGQQPGTQAIKFEQFPFTGFYGATQYGVADHSYSVSTRYNAPVVLAFVADPATQTTRLFVDGVDTGSTVPFAVSLSGLAALGGSLGPPGPPFDLFEGTIIAAATYNSRLSGADIAANAAAFYIPAPAAGAPLILCTALLVRRRRNWR